MIVKKIKNKLIITTIALLVVLLVYIFPNGSDPEVYEQNISYVETKTGYIYLKDNKNFIARTDVIMQSNETTDRIKEIIELLTINGSKKDYIPNGFEPLIPEKTKVLSLDLDNGLLKINFSTEFLNLTKDNEEQVIEAIIFSLTEIDKVNKIMIYVDNVKLDKLPISKRKLPLYLTKEYGINKIYNLNSLSNSSTTTIYYLSRYKDRYYYVPISTLDNSNTSKIEIVIKNLKSTPIYQNNLISYMVNEVNLISYEYENNMASLNFNNYILDNFDDNTISEEVKYTILLSLRDTLDINTVVFNVNDKKIDELSIEK